MLLKLLIPFLTPMALFSSCAQETQPVVPVKDNSCRVFRSITWEPADTTKTVEQVRAHNAKLWSLCGRKKT